jgi:hypothetical protein
MGISTSRHVSTAEVDTWHHIKKKLKIKKLKEKKRGVAEPPPLATMGEGPFGRSD